MAAVPGWLLRAPLPQPPPPPPPDTHVAKDHAGVHGSGVEGRHAEVLPRHLWQAHHVSDVVPLRGGVAGRRGVAHLVKVVQLLRTYSWKHCVHAVSRVTAACIT